MRALTRIGLLVSLLAPAGAAAQTAAECPAPAATEEETRALAGRWFATGEEQVRGEQLEEALDSFLCSLSLMPHENTVFNLAQLTKLLEDKQLALARFEQFLDDYPTSAASPEVEKLIARLEEDLGIAAEEPPPAPPPPPAQPSPPVDSGPDLLLPGWIAVGAGAAALIAGGVMQGLAGAAQGEAEEATTYDEFTDSESTMESMQTGAIVGFVAGGLLVGAGAVMLWLDSGEEAPVTVDVSADGSGGAMTLRGRF